MAKNLWLVWWSLVEFFPTPETAVRTGPPSLVLSSQKETTEQQKPSGELLQYDSCYERYNHLLLHLLSFILIVVKPWA
uniref:Uncharacterized protein n=1 Tax=Noccaea caerulescens TaxID=107243 RepID=A0A1J3EPU0_NOCCA